MNQQVIDERQLVGQFQSDNMAGFYRFIEKYEQFIAPIMRARGYKRINKATRTVLFTFGEVTFARSRWSNGRKVRIPVDEKLGLQRRIGLSRELMYQITELATIVPYRKVVDIVELMYGLYITKDTVLRVLAYAEQLLSDKEDYEYFREVSETDKIKADIIFVEGDGVLVKTTEAGVDRHNSDLSHFVVHTGSQTLSKSRKSLKDKKSIISRNNHRARHRLLDYIYSHFDIDTDTVLITNSDNGHGYTPYIFEELAKALKVKHHYHFWDAYHLNKMITDFFKPFPKDLGIQDGVFRALKKHSKKDLEVLLDTAESLLEEFKVDTETFLTFKRKLLQNFKYTAQPSYYQLSHDGIGVMESQHRKITYRMKKRGMYWSPNGADRMSQLIVLSHENTLRDLFFGEWLVEYQDYKYMDSSASNYLVDSETVSYEERMKRKFLGSRTLLFNEL